MSEEKKAEHLRAFFNYVPAVTKPSNAGLKRNQVKKKHTHREAAKPKIYVGSFTFQLQISTKSIARPVKLKKTRPETFAISKSETFKEESEENDESDPLNPNGKSLKSFILLHWKDTFNCPIKVSRYHSFACHCHKFQSSDIVVVKTQRERE